MHFTDAEINAMQDPYSKSPHWDLSATRSAMLTMENSSDIVAFIDAGRRIDGTATVQTIKNAFGKFNVVVDEWAVGAPDFEVMAHLFNEDREPIAVIDTVMLALRTATATPTQIVLTMQLERADYETVNKIILGLGGKWSKSAKAHVFSDTNAEEALANFIETGKLEVPENYGFFPTPPALARILIKEAQLCSESIVLEPEAGVGGLADICAETVPKQNIICYEIQERNCIKLRAKGYTVEAVDFLTVEPVERFTNVLMNPPFRNQADIDHVTHALKFLKPGGTLHAIMGAGITFRKNRKTMDFLALLERSGGTIIENAPDAFKESGTLTRTVRIMMRKPMRQAGNPAALSEAPYPNPMQVTSSIDHDVPVAANNGRSVANQMAFCF